MDYQKSLATWSPEDWRKFGTNGGTFKDFSGLEEDSGGLGVLGDYFGKQTLGDTVKLAGLGIGTFDDLFGAGGKAKRESLKNLKKSGVLMDQQIESNNQAMADRKLFNDNIAKASSNVFGGGLGSLSNKG